MSLTRPTAVIIFYFLWIGQLSANPNSSPPFDPNIKITPASCLLKSGHKHCQQPLVLSWTFEKQIDFCIRLNNGITLVCKKSTKAGQYQFGGQLSATTQFIFEPADPTYNRKKLTVYIVKENKQKLQKRYKHPWSLF